MCATSVRYSASHPLCTQTLPWGKKFAGELRSCTGRELGEYAEIFQAYFPDLGSCLTSSVFQAASLKRRPSLVTQASHVHKDLFVITVSAPLLLSDETLLPKPQCACL